MHHTPPRLNPQAQSVLAHLQGGQTITAAQALKLYGIARLGARVWDLKEAGYNILPERITVKSRRGKASVCRYRLLEITVTPAAS